LSNPIRKRSATAARLTVLLITGWTALVVARPWAVASPTVSDPSTERLLRTNPVRTYPVHSYSVAAASSRAELARDACPAAGAGPRPASITHPLWAAKGPANLASVGFLYTALRGRPSRSDRLSGARFQRSRRWRVLSALASRENGRESED